MDTFLPDSGSGKGQVFDLLGGVLLALVVIASVRGALKLYGRPTRWPIRHWWRDLWS